MVTEKGSETHPLYEVADPVEAKKPSFRLQPNMIDYAATRRKFSWTEVEKEFSWSKTGKVNMAYEAIDRHAEAGAGTRSPCTTSTTTSTRSTPSRR